MKVDVIKNKKSLLLLLIVFFFELISLVVICLECFIRLKKDFLFTLCKEFFIFFKVSYNVYLVHLIFNLSHQLV